MDEAMLCSISLQHASADIWKARTSSQAGRAFCVIPKN
jgi:hypothetical protein